MHSILQTSLDSVLGIENDIAKLNEDFSKLGDFLIRPYVKADRPISGLNENIEPVKANGDSLPSSTCKGGVTCETPDAQHEVSK